MCVDLHPPIYSGGAKTSGSVYIHVYIHSCKLLCLLAAGKVEMTGEIYKHKMQVNSGTQQLETEEEEPSSTTPSKITESAGSLSTDTLPAMPSLDQTQDTSLQQEEQQPEQQSMVVGEGGGEVGEEEQSEGGVVVGGHRREGGEGGEGEGAPVAQEQ